MNQGCVTLDEVFAAAQARAASLVPETSGYLALAVGDATSRLPFAIDERMVLLTTEGNVGITKRGDMLPPKQAARGLREVLGRLLAVSTGTAMPALVTAGRAREESDRGLDAVVEEIEAALIPVNRAAARRALGRLARETLKAKESGRMKPRRPAAAAPKAEPAPAAEPPKPAPVVVVAPHAITEATTPPPDPPAPTPLPSVAAAVVAPPAPPAAVTPPPPVVALVVALPTPPPPEAEPTPTVLGMAPVEIDGAEPEVEGEPQTTLDVATEARPEAPPVTAAVAADEEDAVTQAPSVLGQPSEEPELAFARGARPSRPVLEPMTPPFSLDAEAEPRELPVARVMSAPPRVVAPSRAPVHHGAGVHTRADDLLARFGASCADDAGMREAAACLRRIAGIDATPPPARVEVRIPSAPTPLPPESLCEIPRDAETPLLPRVRARRARSAPSLGITLLVLVLGLAGGGALVRFRPDLFGAARSGETMPPAPAAARTRSAAEAPASTSEPQGAPAPGWKPGGGARAER